MKKLSCSRCRVWTVGSQTDQVLTLDRFKSNQQAVSLYWVLRVCHVVDWKAKATADKLVLESHQPPGKLRGQLEKQDQHR